jgi:glutathionyl-hydroquinone reductase
MGQMVDGVWIGEDLGFPTAAGAFQRPPTRFRNHLAPDGEFPAEAGRYHLYVSLACPWAHRTLIFRRMKRLEGMIGLSVVHWLMREDGWTFTPGPGVVADPVMDAKFMHQLYARTDGTFNGRVTVPVLWDRDSDRIVNNESSEIVRIFNAAFDSVGAAPGDYYPEALRGEIDAVNDRVYGTLNNGVYRAGFARSQQAYEDAIPPLFATLDWLEKRLSQHTYVCGDQLTEADIRLFTTLVRFDPVYHYHFKCNLRRVSDYPALWDYTRALYRHPDIRPTVDFDHIKRHYFCSHATINPTGVVPMGPILDFDAPASRTIRLP